MDRSSYIQQFKTNIEEMEKLYAVASEKQFIIEVGRIPIAAKWECGQPVPGTARPTLPHFANVMGEHQARLVCRQFHNMNGQSGRAVPLKEALKDYIESFKETVELFGE